jgi:hypothetical protein
MRPIAARYSVTPDRNNARARLQRGAQELLRLIAEPHIRYGAVIKAMQYFSQPGSWQKSFKFGLIFSPAGRRSYYRRPFA